MEQQSQLNNYNKQEYPLMHIRGFNTILITANLRSFLLFLLFIGLNMTYCNAQITYRIKTKHFSSDVINSYPQKVITTEKKDGVYDITLQAFITSFDSVVSKIVEEDSVDMNHLYSPELNQFLQPTELIDFQVPEIKNITDTLFKDEKSTYKIILKGLGFASTYLSYDDSLASEIDKGNCFTLPVPVILKTRKGTCGEFTNLFISLMRSKGIPCRFIIGYVYYPPLNAKDSHAWAECYIKGYGWLPVDPQQGQLAFPIQIKLFAGKDYKDCNVKLLSDIAPLSIEIIENKYFNYK